VSFELFERQGLSFGEQCGACEKPVGQHGEALDTSGVHFLNLLIAWAVMAEQFLGGRQSMHENVYERDNKRMHENVYERDNKGGECVRRVNSSVF
jgi:hypothetical protein